MRSRSGQQGSPLFHQDFRVIHVLDGMEHDDDDDDLPTTPSCDLTPQRNSPTERETTVRNQLALDFNLQPSQICVVTLPPFPPALRLQLTASAAESLRHHARQKLICLKAKQLGCSYVLLGDQAATCAQRILLETAQGRGLNLPLACAPVSPLHGIKVMRPLRLLVPQEVEAYCRLRQLNANSTCCQPRSVLQGSLEEATQGQFLKQRKRQSFTYPCIWNPFCECCVDRIHSATDSTSRCVSTTIAGSCRCHPLHTGSYRVKAQGESRRMEPALCVVFQVGSSCCEVK